MNTKINKILVSAIVGTCGLTMTGCTDLDEKLYSVIATEQHPLSQAELERTIAPVYSSLRDVYWGWFGMSDIMDMSSDVWGVPNRPGRSASFKNKILSILFPRVFMLPAVL